MTGQREGREGETERKLESEFTPPAAPSNFSSVVEPMLTANKA